jgi:hypothetical protein
MRCRMRRRAATQDRSEALVLSRGTCHNHGITRKGQAGPREQYAWVAALVLQTRPAATSRSGCPYHVDQLCTFGLVPPATSRQAQECRHPWHENKNGSAMAPEKCRMLLGSTRSNAHVDRFLKPICCVEHDHKCRAGSARTMLLSLCHGLNTSLAAWSRKTRPLWKPSGVVWMLKTQFSPARCPAAPSAAALLLWVRRIAGCVARATLTISCKGITCRAFEESRSVESAKSVSERTARWGVHDAAGSDILTTDSRSTCGSP